MDYQMLSNLFGKEVDLPEYSHKRWVKINPTKNTITGENAIDYHCKTVADRLVDYGSGYILLTVTAARAALAAKEVAPKGSFAFINQAVVSINGTEVDNTKLYYITVHMLNSLEYSNDYARVAEQYCYSKDTVSNSCSAGHTVRKALIPDPANNELKFSVKIPLSYVSNFFRALDFSIINQEFQLSVTYRTTNALLREGGVALACTNSSAIMHLPIVDLHIEHETEMNKKMSSGSMTKTLVWNKIDYLQEVIGANGLQDRQLAPSVNGMRKLYRIAVPTARWDSQEYIESTPNTKITDINIVIDNEDFYRYGIKTDIEAYDLVAENFNIGWGGHEYGVDT